MNNAFRRQQVDQSNLFWRRQPEVEPRLATLKLAAEQRYSSYGSPSMTANASGILLPFCLGKRSPR